MSDYQDCTALKFKIFMLFSCSETKYRTMNIIKRIQDSACQTWPPYVGVLPLLFGYSSQLIELTNLKSVGDQRSGCF